MDKQTIIQQVKEIIIECMDLNIQPEQINGTDLINELNINSIDALEIFVWTENRFGFEIPDEDLTGDLLRSLDTFAEYILSRLRESNIG